MSEKKRKHQHQEQEERHEDEEEEHRREYSGDLLEYDPERAQDLIDVEEAAEESNPMGHPNPDDPQHSKKSTTPGQENVPAGFDTGRGMQGGSAKRRKR